jgi:hypothetical protein
MDTVFGKGSDVGVFLSTYAAIGSGDLTKLSIGGQTPRVTGLLGLLGTPQGLSGSHNNCEGDMSPTRGDLYL